MGGLGPGIGGFELVVIALVALLVVGPRDLPVLLRKVGRAMAKARSMANEFRASFDEMARQSELDDLRKEVEALRRGQGMVALGAEADAAFKDIKDDLSRPLEPTPVAAAIAAPEFPDPVAEPATAPVKRKAPAKAKTQNAAKPEAAEPVVAKRKPATKSGVAKSRKAAARSYKVDL